jgi:hypothetical protein
MLCTARRSPRSVTATVPAAATTNANSPKARPPRGDPLAQAPPQRHRLATPRRRHPTPHHRLTESPGRTPQERLCRQRDRLSPQHRLFGAVTTRTLNQPYDHRTDQLTGDAPPSTGCSATITRSTGEPPAAGSRGDRGAALAPDDAGTPAIGERDSNGERFAGPATCPR